MDIDGGFDPITEAEKMRKARLKRFDSDVSQSRNVSAVVTPDENNTAHVEPARVEADQQPKENAATSSSSSSSSSGNGSEPIGIRDAKQLSETAALVGLPPLSLAQAEKLLEIVKDNEMAILYL